MTGQLLNRFSCLLLAGWCWAFNEAKAGTITIQTNIIGPTPVIIGYNAGHFYPGGNTPDWWRYSGVTGARVFNEESAIKPDPPLNDGVSNETSFLNWKSALRANPLNVSSTYVNWPHFTNEYATADLYPDNHMVIGYAYGALRKLGVQIMPEIAASATTFVLASNTDWNGICNLWQYYYAQAFLLGSQFSVQRYQMYNEPNSAGIAQTNYLMRLRIVADAIQAALADVNTIYGRSLAPQVHAPVSAGNATSAYVGWGDLVVTNRHLNYLGVTSTNFWLIQEYDYHQYGGTGTGFGSDLAGLFPLIAADMAPEPALPAAISEFNTRDASSYDETTVSLDSPGDYSRFGSIAVNLMENGASEIYAFKFSQTAYTGNYPVTKNGMHYVENKFPPYDVGGITKAGEVYRLFNKAFTAGRRRLTTVKSGVATNLDAQTSYDPVGNCFHLYIANSTANTAGLSVNLSALDLPATSKVLLEEVSENAYGGGVLWTNVSAVQTGLGTQPANSIWLLTMPQGAQQAEQTVAATDAAEVNDGANSAVNYGGAPAMTVYNNPTNPAGRSVAFMKFQLPSSNLSNLQFALLSLQASSATVNTTVQAHVYGFANANWSQTAITWNSAPNLQTSLPAGNTITNDWLKGQGSNLFIVGQLVVTTNSPSQKLIDVTSYLRAQTNTLVSFLVSQDPRWDVTLPSLAVGDTQPDGIKISTTSGAGPALRLVYGALTNQITGVSDTHAGAFSINFSGTPNQAFRVLAATNLATTNWTSISTNVAGTNGVWNFTDYSATNYPARYYRSVTP